MKKLLTLTYWWIEQFSQNVSTAYQRQAFKNQTSVNKVKLLQPVKIKKPSESFLTAQKLSNLPSIWITVLKHVKPLRISFILSVGWTCNPNFNTLWTQNFPSLDALFQTRLLAKRACAWCRLFYKSSSITLMAMW